MKAGDVVEVEWDDHTLHPDGTADSALALQRSVGYLVSSDAELVRLAMTQTITEGRQSLSEVLVVDRRMVRRVRRVR